MATEVVAVGRWQATVAFLRDSYHEIRAKTTWPDVPQVRQAAIAIILFVLAIGLVISLMDVTLQYILVTLIPALFS